MKSINFVRTLKGMTLLMAFAVLALSRQSGFSGSEKRKQTVDESLLSANTRFAFKLFSEIVKQDSGKNIFVSPSSMAMALSMIYNGAKGETKEAMAHTLELQGMSTDEVNQANAALRTVLANLDPEIQLNIANSLWARRGTPFEPDFMERNEEFYEAKVETLDFTDPASPSIINAWVSEKTNEKITKIVERFDPDDILVLINAIYFKGKWSEPFDEKKTYERDFTLLSGAKKKHPFMHQSDHYQYYQGDKFQAVSLPYGEKTVSMYIFLPDSNSSLEEFLDSLNADNWERWISQFHDMEGDIALPRFKLEYELVCNDVLKSLGMGVAFTERANFKGMSPRPIVFIREVRHKTFIEVKEEGTEAAAATVVLMAEGISLQSFSMIVDRPFFCAIVDNKTGTVLFMGAIVEPM